MSARRSPVDLLLAELAKFPTIDRNAELAVAGQEGLSGRVGDNGTSFGPNQLHAGGALPSWVWQRGPAFAQQWAWSPEGIDYALSHVARVAGGKKGAAAVQAIVGQFERPADPAGEISRALAHYGGAPAGGRTVAAAGGGAVGGGGAALDPVLLALYANNLQTLTGGASSLTPLLALALSGGAPAAATTAASPTRSPASTAAGRFVTVPDATATRAGILLAPSALSSAEQIARQFGVRINSGYRDPSHNAVVGGAQNSDHLRGDAVDFVGSPQQLASLYKYAQGRYPYVEPMSQAKDHVHISFYRP